VGVAAAPFSALSLAADGPDGGVSSFGESAGEVVEGFFVHGFFVEVFFSGLSPLLDDDVVARLSPVVDESELELGPELDDSEPAEPLLADVEPDPPSSAWATPSPPVIAIPTPSTTTPAPNQPYGSRAGLAR